MPTHWVQRIAEEPASMAPEATLQFFAERRQARCLAELDAGIADLATRGLTLQASNFDATLERMLVHLGVGLEAHRVTYYATDPDDPAVLGPNDQARLRFCPLRSWTPYEGCSAANVGAREIELSHETPAECALMEGRAQRWPVLAPDGRQSVRWMPAQASLRIPCSVAAGLFGFFVVESGVSASRWSDERIDRCESLARILAGALDRLRMAAEIECLRRNQGHGERLETLGRVASAVAHDFNNVLTAIFGYTDLLEFELDEDGTGRSDLEEIRKAAARGADLIDQVLAFGRTRDSGVEALDLNATLSSLEGMLRQVVGKEIEVELDFEPRAGRDRVALDPGRLAPVIMNLASNARGALEHVQVDPRFALSTRCVEIGADGTDLCSRASGRRPIPKLTPGRFIRLTARDNGCGIDPAHIERIFEPFFTTKSPGSGTGLGLASLAEFVRESKGAIRIESAPGEGAAFHLYFPILGAVPSP